MAIDVLMGTAPLDDAEGLERFIQGMPNGEALRSKLVPGKRCRFEQYDNDTQSARFLAADGVSFICFVVIGITLSQARMISRQTDHMVEWTVEQFHRVVERALNVTFPKAG